MTVGVSRIYTSADTDAPAMGRNVPGSFIGVLKSVLVNGYGSLTPLGWEIAFEDSANHVCVFRPLEGTFRPFVRVDDSDGRLVEIYLYESMTDVNTGDYPCPLAGDSYRYIYKNYYNDSQPGKWEIIGDERGFYFLNHTFGYEGDTSTNAKMVEPYYIGEFPSFDPSNTYNWIAALSSSNWYSYFYNNTTRHSIMRDPATLDPGAVKVTMTIPMVTAEGILYWPGNYVPIQQVNGQYVYEPAYIKYAHPLNGQYPGLLSPVYGAESGNYILSDAERTHFFDDYSPTKRIYVFPGISYIYYSATHRTARWGIIVGEDFRALR